MPERVRVHITDEVHSLLVAQTRPGHVWKEVGNRNPDGTWVIPLSYPTFERLAEIKLEGESVNETILRLLSTQKGSN